MSQKTTDPLLNRPKSFKGAVLSVFKNMILLNDEQPYLRNASNQNVEVKALFLTSAGLITGEFPTIEEEEKENSVQKLLFMGLDNHIKLLQENHQQENITFTSGAVFTLKNVYIKLNSGEIHYYDEFMLFTEDIIGFWFVPKDFKFQPQK